MRRCRNCKAHCIPNDAPASQWWCATPCRNAYRDKQDEKRKERSAPRTARVSAKPKKRKPRAGDDRKYLDWVKTQPCVICGMPADDPHHIIGLGFGGMGMTAPDTFTIPVCRADHGRIHADPELWQRQPMWVLQTQAKAIQEGVL